MQSSIFAPARVILPSGTTVTFCSAESDVSGCILSSRNICPFDFADNGSLISFGRNDFGQLGLGNTVNVSSPSIVVSSAAFKSVAMGNMSSFAVSG